MGSRPALSRLVLTIQQTLRQTLTSGTPAPHYRVTKHISIDPGRNVNVDSNRITYAPTWDAPKASYVFRPQEVLLFDALRRAGNSKQLQRSVMRAFHQQLQRAATNATHRQLRHHGLPVVAKLATSSSAGKQGFPGVLQLQVSSFCKASLGGSGHLWYPRSRTGMLQHRQRHLVLPTAATAAPGSSSSSGGTGSPAGTQPQQQGLTPPGTSISRSSSSSASWLNDVESGLERGSGSHEPQNKDWLKLVTVAAIGIVICYADRSNMSTAILPMAEAYHWDKAFEGVILSAFFAGYAATQVLGGSLADRYGGKFVLTTGVFLWSLFTVLTPSAAAAGTVPLLAARVLLGVGEGVAFPSIHSMIARNVPVSKRSTAVGIITAASYAGTALAFGLSPLVISRFDWQWVFYLFGASALLWLPFWLPLSVLKQLPEDTTAAAAGSGSAAALQQQQGLGKDSPLSQSAVGGEEGAPLLQRQSFEVAAPSSAAAAAADGSSSSTGFQALLRRREVWAICVCQYAQSYGMYGLLTWLPTFFTDYYGVKLVDLGGYTLLPYVLQGLVGLGAGALADQLLSSRGWSVRSVRVGLQLAGMLGPAACLMAAVSPIVGGSAEAASALITVGLGLSALTLGAVSVNHLDVAPRHAGMVFGAGNTAATLAGLVSVPLTGWVLQKTGSWPIVFGLIGVHFVVGSAVWAAWVGDKPLPEDGPDEGTALPQPSAP